MKVVVRRLRGVAAVALTCALAACGGEPATQETIAAELRQDSLAYLRSQLADQAMQASMFVNEVNKALATARALSASRQQLLSTAELRDVNEERNAVLARVTQLVERLDAARGRIYGLRKEVADKDTALARQLAQFEQSLADANASAETQRAELRAVIDSQTTRIAGLSSHVAGLSDSVTRLTSEKNAVYVVSGTKEELIRKGVLVAEGPRRFGIVGRRPLVPARALDPDVFTRLDRRSDTTIFLPDGVYRMVSRQDGSYAVPREFAHGGIVGALTIEDPDQFWSTSRFLILVKG